MTLHYAVLKPGAFWIEEGEVRVPVTKVDARANFTKRRSVPIAPEPDEPWPATGMNAVEDMIQRRLHPRQNDDDEPDDEGNGALVPGGAL